jgi:hypothetical protein
MWWSQYYDAPIDYSKPFQERVAGLAEQLSEALGADVRHETDMNYNAGQRITVLLTGAGAPTSGIEAASFRVAVMISSRGPVWALGLWKKGGPREWLVASPGELAGIGDRVMTAISATMEAAELRRVPDEVLDDEAEGHVTQMDELPATVRDVLFCEVC